MTISSFIWRRARYLGRLPALYRAFYFFTNLIFRDGTTVILRQGPARGYRWRHYRDYQPWMALGLYEPEIARLIATVLQPNDTFFDIGANAGYFTLIAARAVQPHGKVTAFEPVPRNAATIRTQIKLNHLQRTCVVEEKAVSNTNGPANLELPIRNANAHLAAVEAPHVRKNEKSSIVKVACVTLDQYLEEGNRHPTLIKMDIEGAEVLALNGATKLIHSDIAPSFLITAHSKALEEQVKAILQKAGYHFSSFPHMLHALPPHKSHESNGCY